MKRRIVGPLLLLGGLACLVIGGFLAFSGRAKDQPSVVQPQVQAALSAPTEANQEIEVDEESDPVLAAATRYRETDAAGRKSLIPEAVTILKAYGKNWQGSDERQMLYESSYLELASAIKPDAVEGDDANLIADVELNTMLRLKYLADPTALKSDIDRAREMLLAKEYAKCKDFCEQIVSGCYGRLPGVELALGMCYDALGDRKASQSKFLEVIELCHNVDPDKAAAAAFLAGRGMLSSADYENALKMFEAVQEDYPNSPYAAKARDIVRRMEAALHIAQDDAPGPVK